MSAPVTPSLAIPAPVTLPPDDEHNRRLVDAVHPSDWTNPTPAGRYHLVVVGAGTAGLVSAAIASSLGAKVALVERHLMGGDCLNVGCVPSKGLLRAARAAADVRGAGRFGVNISGDVSVDFGAVMERMRTIRAGIGPHDGAARFRDMGVDVFFGDGRFTGRDSLDVDGTTLTFAKAVIATGGRAAAPPIPGLDGVRYLTNETLFELTERPARLGVIGAGPIGVEMAQAFARFGSRVSLVEQGPHVLMREDEDAAAIVQGVLAREGVDLHTGVKLGGVKPRGDEIVLSLDRDGRADEVVVDELLVAVGRAPNVDGLGLEAAGVAFDPRKGVTVDDHLRTSNKRIYAAGDVCSRFQFTHTADFLARIVVQNALFAPFGLGRKKASALTVPWCTYTDPEIAHVGLYEHEAREQGHDVVTHTQPLAENDRAKLDGDAEGFVRVHLEQGSDKILGATIVARHAGEMISELTLAMRAGAGLGTLADTIHPYPTQADAIRAAGSLHTRTRLTPFAARMLRFFLKLNT